MQKLTFTMENYLEAVYELRGEKNGSRVTDIAERMGVPCDRIVMVGDSGPDVLTAVNAGLVPVGVTWGYRPVEELSSAGARWLIDHPRQLLEVL